MVEMAERLRFELRARTSRATVFKTAAFNRSATSPESFHSSYSEKLEGTPKLLFLISGSSNY